MGWLSIVFLLIRFAINLPDIIAVVKEIWDLIRGLKSRTERAVRKQELVDVLKKHGGRCVKLRDENQVAVVTGECKDELEIMKAKLAERVAAQVE